MNKFYELMRFGTIGFLATATHALVYLVMLALTWPQIANFLGFCLAFLVSYFGHSRFTFKVHKTNKQEETRQLQSFIVVALFGLMLNTAFVYFATQILRLPDWSPIIFIAGVTPVLMYLFLKIWVFRRKT